MPNPVELFLLILKASLITYSGAGPIPVLQQDLVDARGWTTNADIATSIAIGRISPGPGGLFIVSLGYMVMGWAGAALALLAATLPPIMVIPFAPLVRRSMHRPWVRGLMRGLMLGSASLIILIAIGIILPTGFGRQPGQLINIGLGIAGFGVTVKSKLHPLAIISVAAITGLGISQPGL